MKRALEGEPIDQDDPVIVMWREVRLAKTFGWTPDQIDAVPGQWIDWALRIDGMGGPGA